MISIILLVLYVINFKGAESKEYEILSTPGSWAFQKQQCENQGMILATFDGETDVKKLHDLCKASPVNDKVCYLGYEDLDFDRTYRFIDDSEIVDIEAAANWAPGEPHHYTGHRCGVVVARSGYNWPGVLADGACSGWPWNGICEILEDANAPETLCGDYLYYDSYGAKTYLEADGICGANGYSLATISDQTDCDCIKTALVGLESAWIGLNAAYNEIGFFQQSDGSGCPSDDNGLFSGACLGKKCWVNKKPTCKDEGGSNCVYASSAGINNDVLCAETRNAILCNAN